MALLSTFCTVVDEKQSPVVQFVGIMIIERPIKGVFNFCPSEAASISGSVDDVIEDELL